MKNFYTFHTESIPDLSEVGGKGLSLIHMTKAGFSVPPGFILTVDFFNPWIETLEQCTIWQEYLSGKNLQTSCAVLKEKAMEFTLSDKQSISLKEALETLPATGLVAVRSSSPEEDLEGASFAGGYETMLGVTPEKIKEAVKQAFASCLDTRVFLYKKEHGFNTDHPRIAVIIQSQIASEKAGVAFSLNPLNNCYDEAVINSNWGLGESVVSGNISPDQFILDKVTGNILEKKKGKKEMAIYLNKEGGTTQKESPQEISLTHNELSELLKLTGKVEDYYNIPMDIEWAFAEGKLYLLQARPITAYIPLHPDMQTKPGEPRRLYWDWLLAVEGFYDVFSMLGLEYLDAMVQSEFKLIFGPEDIPDPEKALFFSCHGRSYANVSIFLKLQGSKWMSQSIGTLDISSLKIFSHLNKKEYAVGKLPKKYRGFFLKMLFTSLATIKKSRKILNNPAEYHRLFLEQTGELERRIQEWKENHSTFTDFASDTSKHVIEYYLGQFSYPLSMAAEYSRSKIKKILKKESPEIRDKIINLEQALPNNVTIEMGLALYALSRFDDIEAFETEEDFIKALKEDRLSEEFEEAWESFMEKYGHRCPQELDAATPRFYENPVEIFNQLKTMRETTNEKNNPALIFKNGVKKRNETFSWLYNYLLKKNKRKARLFKKHYTCLETFGAYREIHKYYAIFFVDLLRQKVLKTAKSLVKQGRLKRPEDVFNLNLEQLDRVIEDPSLDIQSIIEANTRFTKSLKHIKVFPRFIDSRGKVLHASKPKAKEGEVAGEPISPGIIRGKVKVLHRADEKPLLPGEILVAKATDPGWTPLFLTAGGIVLEVGGMLQHGALVAREYCKPCIVGVENVTELFKDGQEIEMDGATGVIRILAA